MDFNLIWDVLKGRGRVAHFYQMECEHLWSTFSEEQQQAIFDAIQTKLHSGRFVHYNPANALRDNVPKQRKIQILSYADYYRTFGTTEEQGGWIKKYLSDQQKTIYVKN